MRRHPPPPSKSLSKRLFSRSLLVAGALAACLWAAPVLAQTQNAWPPLKWTARGRYLTQTGVNANDEGTAIGYYLEPGQGGNPDQPWVYSAGWVTELNFDGSVKGTRFAVFQYDAKASGQNGALAPTHTAYFPPAGLGGVGISQGDTYKVYAMAVDNGITGNGDVYIVGEGPHTAGGANNQDYIVVKYDKDLQPVWSGVGVGVGRYYNGTGNGNDIPVGITLDEVYSAVVVTGTSPSVGNGNDIATVAWHAAPPQDGVIASDLWPADLTDPAWPQPQGGVRRFDNTNWHGNDRAAGLVSIAAAPPQGSTLTVFVLGTTYNGPSALDDFTTHQWSGAGPAPAWNNYFNLGGNDTARGIQGAPELGWLWCNGYSEIPAQFDGPGDDIDYSIVSYDANGLFRWSDSRDYQHLPDYAAPLTIQSVPNAGVHIWIPGEGTNTSSLDAFTIHYFDTGAGGHTPDFTTGFLPSTNFAYGTAVALPNQDGIPIVPYITGAAGFNAGTDYMLTLKYTTNPSPPYIKAWNRLYDNGGFDEGRAIVVRQVDGTAVNVSVYIVGTSAASGNGRDLCTWRYRQ